MQVIYWDKNTPRRLDIISKMSFDNGIYKTVNRIIQEIARKGDSAIRRFTKEFDSVDITPKRLRVTQSEVNRAYEKIDVNIEPKIEDPDTLKRAKQCLKSTKDGVSFFEQYCIVTQSVRDGVEVNVNIDI